MRCFRFQAKAATQVMAALPSARVTPTRAFKVSAVDYAGPYYLKNIKGRSTALFKGYIVIFICLATRAIHADLAPDMRTETFLNVLKRFISRRGCPSDMHSDNGTNFEGASNTLKDFKEIAAVVGSSEVKNEMSSLGINWHFNPPIAPHMGGVWEIGVKLIKTHLKRILSSESYSFEEFYTILTQVEACVNSRPLTALSANPDDLEPLTPGHFLIGTALTAPPEPSYLDISLNRLNRYQLLARKVQEFWARWSTEYLARLHKRPKWAQESPNFKVGDLCIMIEDSPPLEWRLARISQIHPGEDGNVRVVTLMTQGSYDKDGKRKIKTFKRPISKLAHLPLVYDTN